MINKERRSVLIVEAKHTIREIDFLQMKAQGLFQELAKYDDLTEEEIELLQELVNY